MKKKKKKVKIKQKLDFSIYKKGSYTTIKCPIGAVIKPENLYIINNLVLETQEITYRTYMFLRLYILYKFNNYQTIPDITEEFVRYCICAQSVRNIGGSGRPFKNLELFDELNSFYENEFSQVLGKERFDLKHKGQLINYISTTIVTSVNNNIKEHWLTRVRRFMNLSIPDDLKTENIEDKEEIKTLKKKWNSIKENVLRDEIWKIEKIKHKAWAIEFRTEYLPYSCENCFGYDVKVEPNKYIYYTLKMNKIQEEFEFQEIKLFQPIPLRTSIIPGYITLDAPILISNFKKLGESAKIHKIKEFKEEIWSRVFNMKHKIMNLKNYQINSVQTDGVGLSILFQKIGTKRKSKNVNEFEEQDELYIDEIRPCDLKQIQTKNLISVDPNKQALVQMWDKNGTKLRYTASQVRIESFSKRNRRNILKLKNSTKIGEETITEIETRLCDGLNCKTVNYNKFKKYISSKVILNDQLSDFYNQRCFRKMKLRSWIYRRKSEDVFLNKIESTFGNREDIFIGYGNWSTTKQMKYIMPTKGVGLRRIIRKRFSVALVDEFRTSKVHYETQTFIKEHAKVKNKNGKEVKLHRVLKIEVDKDSGLENKKSIFVNRDINACKNILCILKDWVFNQTRPQIYCRPPKNQLMGLQFDVRGTSRVS